MESTHFYMGGKLFALERAHQALSESEKALITSFIRAMARKTILPIISEKSLKVKKSKFATILQMGFWKLPINVELLKPN